MLCAGCRICKRCCLPGGGHKVTFEAGQVHAVPLRVAMQHRGHRLQVPYRRAALRHRGRDRGVRHQPARDARHSQEHVLPRVQRRCVNAHSLLCCAFSCVSWRRTHVLMASRLGAVGCRMTCCLTHRLVAEDLQLLGQHVDSVCPHQRSGT